MAYSIEYVYKLIDQYTPTIEKIQKELNNFGDKAEKAGDKAHKAGKHGAEGFKLFGIAVGSILTAETLIKLGEKVAEFSNECVTKFHEAQETMSAFGLTFKNNGGKVKLTMQEITDSAEKISFKAFMNADDIIAGSTNVLLRYGNVSGEVFTRAEQLSIDMSTAMNGVKGAAGGMANISQQIGRALETGNVTAFMKMGLFTKEQQKWLSQLFKTGRMEEAQTLILKQLEGQFKGFAETQSQTGIGLQMRMEARITDIQETIGESLDKLKSKFLLMFVKILEYITPFVKKGSELIEKLIPVFDNILLQLGKAFETIRPTLGAFIAALMQLFGSVFGKAINNTGALNTALSIMAGIFKVILQVATFAIKILNFLAPIIPIIIWAVVIWKAYVAIMTLWNIIGAIWAARQIIMIALQWAFNVALSANPIGLVIIAIAALIAIIVLIIIHWKELVPLIQAAWERFKGLAMIIGGPMTFAFVQIVEVVRAFMKHWDAITAKFKSGDILGGILEIGKALLSGILSPIESLLKLLASIPGIGKTVFGGISDMTTGFKASLDASVSQKTTVPVPKTNNINVKTQNELSVYTEKDQKVVPYKKGNNLGYNMVGVR